MSNNPPLLTPAEIRRDGAKFVVTVEGRVATVASSRPEATSALCRFAIQREEQLVVTVLDGAGKSYLHITEFGVVSPSAAPAPSTVRSVPSDGRLDLGSAPDAVDTTRAWVEETMLDVETDEPAPPRKRFGFGRRG